VTGVLDGPPTPPSGPSGPSGPSDELDAVDARRQGHVARNAALAVGVVLVALVALLATAKTSDERQPEARILGQAVPAVQGSTMGGGTYDIDDHLGNWVVVNFFASWCTPCRVEQPELVKFDDEHSKAGDVEIVSVVFQDDEADVKAFFDSSGASWPVIVGDTGSIALQFGVTAVPESYIVSPDGQVVAKFENVTAAQLDAVIARYAASSSASSSSSSTVAP
jgi:cytochrome c biogenesis protein CcmG/thiol:disulfide interchange protein DsbE